MNRRLTIFVVDDEPRLRTLLADTLRDDGHDVVACASAEEADRKLHAAPCDLLFLDLHLPGQSGLELLQTLRARQAPTQVVIVSGYATLDDAKSAIHHDVLELLSKPFLLSDVEKAVQKCLDRLARSKPAASPAAAPLAAEPSPRPPTLAEVEMNAIQAALARHHHNKSAAAEELGISRRTLYNRLQQASD